jgi:hypothetical protein
VADEYKRQQAKAKAECDADPAGCAARAAAREKAAEDALQWRAGYGFGVGCNLHYGPCAAVAEAPPEVQEQFWKTGGEKWHEGMRAAEEDKGLWILGTSIAAAAAMARARTVEEPRTAVAPRVSKAARGANAGTNERRVDYGSYGSETAETAETAFRSTPQLPQPSGRASASRYSGPLVQVNKPDPNADALAQRLGGQSRVKFSNDRAGREFDAVSDEFVGQTKPATKQLSQDMRDQFKATFEAARQTGKRPYFHFEGTPNPRVIAKINEYGARYNIKPVIDTKPLEVPSQARPGQARHEKGS